MQSLPFKAQSRRLQRPPSTRCPDGVMRYDSSRVACMSCFMLKRVLYQGISMSCTGGIICTADCGVRNKMVQGKFITDGMREPGRAALNTSIRVSSSDELIQVLHLDNRSSCAMIN
jgi:hypothetical protein